MEIETKKDALHSDLIKVMCFGEVLWDNLPTGRKPGGAPMNVAYHLHKLGIDSSVLSRIGRDRNGKDLLDVLTQLDIDTANIQIDDFNKTSTVEVNISTENEVEYDIVFPVAWDFIELEAVFEEQTANADAFVFGSLAGRSTVTRTTLNKLLDIATFRVFDVNLRDPYFEKGYVRSLLRKTDLLKLNQHELSLIVSWFSYSSRDEKSQIKLLQDEFGIKEIIVTKGAQGASFYVENQVYHQPAYQILVKDTVGSGDAFLAAFLSKRHTNLPIETCLSFAAGLSAYVTTKSGACPAYSMIDLNKFISGIS